MKERDSNFELLRIIAMLFIVTWHISIHAQNGELESHGYITAICTTGVNIFILISGYFNIRTTWKSILTLYGTFVFYYITTIALNWYIFGETPHAKSVLALFSPTTHSPWWFIACYMQLQLLSPLINNLLSTSNEKMYAYTIGILLFISCYSGFVFQNQINITGYNIFNFITIYAIGDAIRKYNIQNWLSPKFWFGLYLVATICMFIASQIEIQRIIFYNNPLLIASSICLFCLISRFRISNKKINIIATYMLPLYLLQESTLGYNVYKYLVQRGKNLDFTGFDYYCLLWKYLLGLFACAIIADFIRRQILNKPTNFISKFLDKKMNLFH